MKTFATQPQYLLAAEFCDQYGLSPEQISFKDDAIEPNFDFEALNKLALELADIDDLTIDLDRVDKEIGLVTCICRFVTSTGKTRAFFASCLVGEQLPNGVVEAIDQAINICRARALRVGLRAAGFDPLAAHRARQNGQRLNLIDGDTDEGKQLREIHALATELGYITKDDDSAYRNLMRTFFPPITSAKALTTEQRQQFTTTLRALLRVKTPNTEMAKAA